MARSKNQNPDDPDINELDGFADHAAALAETRVIEAPGEEDAPIVMREGEEPPAAPGDGSGELMSLEEWREFLRFGIDMAASMGGDDFAAMMVQPNEEAQFAAAADASYRLLDRNEFTRKLLLRGNSLIKDLFAIGAFVWLKVRILGLILDHKRALAAQAEARASEADLDNLGDAAQAEGG